MKQPSTPRYGSVRYIWSMIDVSGQPDKRCAHKGIQLHTCYQWLNESVRGSSISPRQNLQWVGLVGQSTLSQGCRHWKHGSNTGW